MAIITVNVKIPSGGALPSVGGEVFVTLLTQNHAALETKRVGFNTGVAIFDSLPLGTYTILVRNSQCRPVETQHTCFVTTNTLYDIDFIYNLDGTFKESYAY